jgi:exosome complex component RRP4
MITFASFPASSDNTFDRTRHHPDLDILMDDDDDFEAGGSKLTCPGEGLTSSSAFMRLVDFDN